MGYYGVLYWKEIGRETVGDDEELSETEKVEQDEKYLAFPKKDYEFLKAELDRMEFKLQFQGKKWLGLLPAKGHYYGYAHGIQVVLRKNRLSLSSSHDDGDRVIDLGKHLASKGPFVFREPVNGTWIGPRPSGFQNIPDSVGYIVKREGLEAGINKLTDDSTLAAFSDSEKELIKNGLLALKFKPTGELPADFTYLHFGEEITARILPNRIMLQCNKLDNQFMKEQSWQLVSWLRHLPPGSNHGPVDTVYLAAPIS